MDTTQIKADLPIEGKDIIHVTSVTLNKSEMDLEEGQVAQLRAIVYPVEASDKVILWKSSDPSVASVSLKGYVSAKKKGIASISATSSDGGKRATCQVTVVNKVPGIEPAQPVVTQPKTNDWNEVKRMADNGDIDACSRFAIYSYNSGNYDDAHKYALKAGKSKGTSVILKLRKDGYYDEGVADPGWK